MSTLQEQITDLSYRTDRLEVVFERFVRSMNQTIREMKAEGARDRAESARVREAADRAREEDRKAAARAWEAADRAREEDRKAADRAREEDRKAAERAREEDRKAAERAREEDRKAADRARKEDRKEWNRRWGELANKMGTVVQDIVAPSLRRIARDELNCGEEQSFSVCVSRYRSDDRHYRREFDALYVGTRGVLLNETKSTVLSEYATRFVRFLKSGEFALYFPEYRDLTLVPVFSSLRLPKDLIPYLTKNGIYAVSMGEETMQVLNRDAVSARKLSPPARPAGSSAK